MNRRTISTFFVVVILLSTVLMPNLAFAASDTTDGLDEIFYEWVEEYDNIHSDTYNYDLDNSTLAQKEYIDFHENDPGNVGNVVTNLANSIVWDASNPWYVNGYYINNSAMERDWDYLERASYNIETADIAIFGGHGIDGKSMQFNRLYTDSHLTQADADFGYNDLDWVFLLTCNWLKYKDARVLPSKILGGAHSIMGYGTTMWMDPPMTTYLGNLLTGYYGSSWRVKSAWHEMNRLYPGPATSESNPTISVVYGATVDENDYLWDEGSVGPYPGNNPPEFWSSITYTALP